MLAGAGQAMGPDLGPCDPGGHVASPPHTHTQRTVRCGSPTVSPPARFKCPAGTYASSYPGRFRFSAQQTSISLFCEVESDFHNIVRFHVLSGLLRERLDLLSAASAATICGGFRICPCENVIRPGVAISLVTVVKHFRCIF